MAGILREGSRMYSQRGGCFAPTGRTCREPVPRERAHRTEPGLDGHSGPELPGERAMRSASLGVDAPPGKGEAAAPSPARALGDRLQWGRSDTAQHPLGLGGLDNHVKRSSGSH